MMPVIEAQERHQSINDMAAGTGNMEKSSRSSLMTQLEERSTLFKEAVKRKSLVEQVMDLSMRMGIPIVDQRKKKE